MKGAAKLVAGVTGTLAGTQMVGMAYDLPVLDRALTTPLKAMLENGQGVLGLAVAGGGVAAGKFAAQRLTKAFTVGEARTRNLALGLAGGATSAAAILGGAELIGRNFQLPVVDRALTGIVEALASGGVGAVAGGSLLTAGAAQLGYEAVQNFRRKGNDFVTLAQSMGAVTAALGGVQLAGYGLGLQATRGLLTDHAGLVGSAAITGVGAAFTRTSLESAKKSGLTPLNSLGIAAGAALIPGGLAAGAATVGADQVATLLGRGAGALGGLGLGLTTVAMTGKAWDSAVKGDVVPAVGYAVGAAASAATGLLVVGESLGVPALQHASRKILTTALEPVLDHVVSPAAHFLFNHPVAGGAALAIGVGGYLYAKYARA